jgi:hypothetical protein
MDQMVYSREDAGARSASAVGPGAIGDLVQRIRGRGFKSPPRLGSTSVSQARRGREVSRLILVEKGKLM